MDTPEWAEQWNGEADNLADHEEELAEDNELCERVFSSKREAFAAGLALGEVADHSPVDDEQNRLHLQTSQVV